MMRDEGRVIYEPPFILLSTLPFRTSQIIPETYLNSFPRGFCVFSLYLIQPLQGNIGSVDE